jgi:hypothetical protein
MQHAHVEVPQQELAIVTNAAEAIALVIASPRVECNSRHPRVVTWTSGDDLPLVQ